MDDDHEIITLDSSSDSSVDSSLIDLEDRTHQTPDNNANTHPGGMFLDPQAQYENCLRSITEFFPDISHDHVQTLYGEYLGTVELNEAANAAEVLISRILDSKTYPKEKDRLKDLKRKRSEGMVDDEAEAAKWKAEIRGIDPQTYVKLSKAALQDTFQMVPARYIDAKISEHGDLYSAYLDIADTERRYSQISPQPYTKLKARRLNTGPNHDDIMRRLRQKEAAKGDKLELELQAAHERKLRDDDAFEVVARTQALETAREQEERDRGEVLECGCCFDTIPISKITQCNAETAHFFCIDCARMNAENDIGMNRFALTCMDGSGCQATFSRAERAKFMDGRTLAKLESLEQQASIQGAMSELFDFVTCPFCEYGHICPPVEEDKEFRCGFPECREVTCRLCKERTHVPMTCEEFKKEHGLSERHIVEEARTEALLRSCPKCKVRILKEDGCNKVVCTTCRSAICDYCGQDITTEQYLHFDGQGATLPVTNKSGKCPLYDTGTDRKEKQIGAAEKRAQEAIRKENPDISEEDLEMKFSNEVKALATGNEQRLYQPGIVPPLGHRRGVRFRVAMGEAARNRPRHQHVEPVLGPMVNQPIVQPQAPRHEPPRPFINPVGQIPQRDQQPGLLGIGRLPQLTMPPRPRLNADNLQALNIRPLEQEQALRRQMWEADQATLVRLMEQQTRIHRQLGGQPDALRNAVPAFEPPAAPNRFQNDPFGLPFYDGPLNFMPGMPAQQAYPAGQWPPQFQDLPHRNQQLNQRPGPVEGPDVAARRNRLRQAALLREGIREP